MLVLTRKLHERIQIGDDITISILRVKGNQVRVGIEAPAHVRVLRSELPRFEDETSVGPAPPRRGELFLEPEEATDDELQRSPRRQPLAGMTLNVA